MNSSPLSINQGFYFPLPFRIVGGALPFFALFFIGQSNYILSGLALIMAFLLLSTRYEIIIDFTKKTYQEHLWILGFKRGEAVSFNAIEKTVIHKKDQSRTYNSRGSTSTVRYTTYHLLLMVDGNTIELLESESKRKIDNLQKKLATYISSVPVEDRT